MYKIVHQDIMLTITNKFVWFVPPIVQNAPIQPIAQYVTKNLLSTRPLIYANLGVPLHIGHLFINNV